MLDLGEPELTLGLSTLVSHSGSLVHVGQTFFNESWNDQVFQTSPYNANTHNRTYNSDDSILGTAFQNGYSAYTRYVQFAAAEPDIEQVFGLAFNTSMEKTCLTGWSGTSVRWNRGALRVKYFR